MNARLANLVPDVSRETVDALASLADEIGRWTRAINLVARNDAPSIWSRHILDSAQLWGLPTHRTHWVDLGSGGGMPALVIAILARQFRPDARITMIEADLRKAAFLRTQIARHGLNAQVIAKRIEAAPPQAAPTVTARALAPLVRLLPMVHRHLGPNGTAILPKGRRYKDEIALVHKIWQYRLVVHPSRCESEAVILQFDDLARA